MKRHGPRAMLVEPAGRVIRRAKTRTRIYD